MLNHDLLDLLKDLQWGLSLDKLLDLLLVMSYNWYIGDVDGVIMEMLMVY